MTSLRFATACGMSDRLRLDLVLNDFVACALSSGESRFCATARLGGRSSRCVTWRGPSNGRSRDLPTGGPVLAVNVGSDGWNFQVKDLAQSVADSVPGTSVSINADAPPDKRSYKVDFSLFKKLAPNHQPLQTLDSAVAGLRDGDPEGDQLR